ncbi:MAG: RNA polymerase sigma factor [Christensenellaceae bacterium]|nr:RNA polymerase sigma factor [Christensenellaceae bacterium]
MDEQVWLARMREAEESLYHVACAILTSETDRRDAMQETALRAWEHRRSLRNEAYFKTWATRIAINVCRDIMRKNRRVMPVEGLPERPAPELPSELHLTIEGLPERLRLPLVLYYLEGFSVEETARALGLPEGTVKFRLHQARKALRVELDGEEAHAV